MDIKLVDKEGNDVLSVLFSNLNDLDEKVIMLTESHERYVLKSVWEFETLKQTCNTQTILIEKMQREIDELKSPKSNFWTNIKTTLNTDVKDIFKSSRVKQINVDLT